MAERSLPQNLDAERALLGSILLDNSALNNLGEPALSPDDFYADANRLIFRQIIDLSHQRHAIDVVTLSEELRKRKTIDKCGGIVYLASLSDGVPVGDYEFVRNYARIVREKSALRRLINGCSNLMTRAFQADEDPEMLVDDGARIMAEVRELSFVTRNGHKPEADKEIARFTHNTCPEIPANALHPIVREYVDLVRPTTEASPNFHGPCFMAACGLMASPFGNSRAGGIYFVASEEVWPIIYLLLVGEAGATKKGTAIAKAFRLAYALRDDIKVLRSIDSAEGFVRQMEQAQGQGRVFQPFLFRLSEFRSMLAKANRDSGNNITSKLCEAYDRDALEINTSGTMQNPIKVPDGNPYAIFMAATSKAYMKMLGETDIEGGMGSRTIYIPGAATDPIAEPPDIDIHRLNALKAKLSECIQFWREIDKDGKGTRIVRNAEAQAMWKAFYDARQSQIGEDEQLQRICSRLDHHCLKASLINTWLDCKPVMGPEQLAPAINFAWFLIEGAAHIFTEHGLTPKVEIERKIYAMVEPRMPVGMNRRQLQQKMWKKNVDGETFKRIMAGMVSADPRSPKAGILWEELRGREKWVLITDWTPPNDLKGG